MSAASHYWRWVKINATGTRIVEEVPEAKAFMQAQFSSLLDSTDDTANLPDAEVQQTLLNLTQTEDSHQGLAECCLRCFISHRIDWTCRDLALKFGQNGQFDHFDLLPFVLDDTEVVKFRKTRPNPTPNQSTYQSVASTALEQFDPARSQLSNWTKRIVMSNPGLNRFLQAQGVYLESSWAILNSASPQYLQRRLTLAAAELKLACLLLESYRAVYLRDRRQSAQSARSKCLPPTAIQLTEMADLLSAQTGKPHPHEDIVEDLHQLADQIRQARHPKVESTDDETHGDLLNEQPTTEPEDTDQQDEFLNRYRHEFRAVLTEAIGQTVLHRFNHLHRKDEAKAQIFLEALFLFHCQAVHMTEIGRHLQLKQYQLSRLLELLKLREDVKRHSVVRLRNRIRTIAAKYVTLEQLEQLMDEIDKALEEEVDRVLEEARAEASTANRNDEHKSRSLFSTLLCRYLDECPYFDHRS